MQRRLHGPRRRCLHAKSFPRARSFRTHVRLLFRSRRSISWRSRAPGSRKSSRRLHKAKIQQRARTPSLTQLRSVGTTRLKVERSTPPLRKRRITPEQRLPPRRTPIRRNRNRRIPSPLTPLRARLIAKLKLKIGKLRYWNRRARSRSYRRRLIGSAVRFSTPGRTASRTAKSGTNTSSTSRNRSTP